MKLYCTEILAVDPQTNTVCLWGGPNVPGISFQDAEEYCQHNGLGYCKVVGELVSETPCKPGTQEPDFDKTIDYENVQNN
jgi:hypothetical protein